MRRSLRPVVLKKACREVLIAFGIVCFPLWGLAVAETDDLFAGFEKPDALSEPIEAPTESILRYISGYAKVLTVYNTTHFSPGQVCADWHGLSKLRLESLVEVDFRIDDWKVFAGIKGFYDFAYDLNGRDSYSKEVLDAYEKEIELREAYLQGSLTAFADLKIGRQIVIWGRSDNFRVTDILNPLDNRDIGLVDIEDLRLPLVMVKVDFFSGDWNVDLISVHEHRYDENPVFGHFFYPSNVPLPSEVEPAYTLENSEIGAALNGNFAGWDLSFYAARTFQDQANFVPMPLITREHQKITMLGSALSLARGNMLYIAEAAHLRGLHFLEDYQTNYNRSELLAGIEYSGLSETVISLDFVTRYLHNYNPDLDTSPEGPRRTDNDIACRVTSNFMNETLELEGVVVLNGIRGQYGALQRFTATYDIMDDWSVNGGLMLFQARKGALAPVGDNGRIFCELRYDF
ncbi:MAG: DUF1302 domain-containing protein [Proteobacteria bacterium]|nr:DUF1302 domain-containing protein [Pseudomonadota bacterium]